MSKIAPDVLADAVQAILTHSTDKKRKFLETIELQIALKNYDPQKDKRFSGVVDLPLPPRAEGKYTVCIIGDAKDASEAKKQGLIYKVEEDLKSMKKDKKLVKKFCRQYP